ncbi:hypothetical protein BS78_08G068900 [Paspalum vaginatum]|nr:hypothetical protein BS78_08G068900 [Paspalum vaginatum]
MEEAPKVLVRRCWWCLMGRPGVQQSGAVGGGTAGLTERFREVRPDAVTVNVGWSNLHVSITPWRNPPVSRAPPPQLTGESSLLASAKDLHAVLLCSFLHGMSPRRTVWMLKDEPGGRWDYPVVGAHTGKETRSRREKGLCG